MPVTESLAHLSVLCTFSCRFANLFRLCVNVWKQFTQTSFGTCYMLLFLFTKVTAAWRTNSAFFKQILQFCIVNIWTWDRLYKCFQTVNDQYLRHTEHMCVTTHRSTYNIQNTYVCYDSQEHLFTMKLKFELQWLTQ